MSKNERLIGLIATEIEFTFNSIVYKVEPEQKFTGNRIVVSANDIKDKDLILKLTFFNNNENEVIFATNYATPHFYQAIVNKEKNLGEEYSNELEKIYGIGDVVGYILK